MKDYTYRIYKATNGFVLNATWTQTYPQGEPTYEDSNTIFSDWESLLEYLNTNPIA